VFIIRTILSLYPSLEGRSEKKITLPPKSIKAPISPFVLSRNTYDMRKYRREKI
jgi:hypothetical protein